VQKTALGVKGFITKNGKVLVLVKPNGDFDLPGGRVEVGESFKDSLHREIFEETGLKVEIIDPIKNWSFIKSSGLLVTGLTYSCRYLSGEVTLSDEHSKYFWSNHEEISSVFFLGDG
jgi:8-oxo-dGTP diphosphatase